ncbi:unnamed protein product [Chondrus crispus]|uniref:Uncharacterized protein n=1 Tax=Chondrus crispus TaxID=2769 RepID=R7Q3K7_CHOCR|nr:unnamed protein product [Chondrus crispus]CDF33117.1 unnamed protein product [Chondrus crispus]|eukprot:XP_005712920.1 unnamed protein product [Chondrus crispus]
MRSGQRRYGSFSGRNLFEEGICKKCGGHRTLHTKVDCSRPQGASRSCGSHTYYIRNARGRWVCCGLCSMCRRGALNPPQ